MRYLLHTVKRVLHQERQHLGDLVAVLRDPYECANAGINWPDREFRPIEWLLVRRLGTSPPAAGDAGLCWPDERFFRHASRIIKAVASDAEASERAGYAWSDPRYELAGERFGRALLNSPDELYRAFFNWPPARLAPWAPGFVAAYKAAQPDTYTALLAGLPAQNLDLLAAYLEAPYITADVLARRETVPKPSRAFWWTMVRRNGPSRVLPLTNAAVVAATRAHAFALQVNQQNAYFAELAVTLDAGTTEAWAQAIIDGFSGDDRSLERAVGGAP